MNKKACFLGFLRIGTTHLHVGCIGKCTFRNFDFLKKLFYNYFFSTLSVKQKTIFFYTN